jgi:hypothetical protein
MKRALAWIKANPVIAFVIGLVVITLILGAASFMAGNADRAEREEQEAATPTPTPRQEEEEPTPSEEDEEDTTPTRRPTTADDDEAEPTARPTTRPTTASATATPAPTATPAGVSINLLGDLYADKNCNGTRDGDESTLNLSGVTVNIYRMPEKASITNITTNSAGHYSYNSTLKSGESIKLIAEAVAPSGYKASPKFSYPIQEFGSGGKRVDIPFVPNENEAACTASPTP